MTACGSGCSNARRSPTKRSVRRTSAAAPPTFFFHAAGTGTGTLEVQEGAESPLEFRILPIGSYYIVENGRGVVDRLFREWKLTIQQAIDLFGERALPRKLLEGDPSKRLTQEEKFIFAVYPRPVEEQRDLGPEGMPIAGCVIHEATKTEVARYGWEERPTITYRFQEGPDGSPWGVGPGVLALCDMRGVNYLDSLIARGVGKIIDPPLAAVKGSLTGPLDLTRGGVSLVNDPANRPMPIAEVGNLNVGDAFLTKKEDQLRRHFHTELFEAFLNLQREITRYEAQQRRAEQLDRFAPVFHRTTTEFVNPLLERVFMILLRSGHFPPPPREAIVQTPSGPKILYPKAIQTSRMAVSFAAIGQQAFRELMADLLPIAQVDPTVLDNFNFNAAARMLASGTAALAEVVRPADEVAAMQEAKAQQAAQQQALQVAGQIVGRNPELLANAPAA